jgi:hypothetical protein
MGQRTGGKKAAPGIGRRFCLQCGRDQVFCFDDWVLLSEALASAQANAEVEEPAITRTTTAAMILDTDHLLSRVDETPM